MDSVIKYPFIYFFMLPYPQEFYHELLRKDVNQMYRNTDIINKSI